VSRTIVLTGEDLTLADVWGVAVHGTQAELADAARDRMRAARELLDSMHGEHTYGVNTGFGRFVSAHVPEELAEELQLRLLRSHACGVGEPYADEVVRGAMLLRANALAKGYSGARVETVELLVACLNRGVLPVVPSRGSVGASGDLAPLAHLALPLVGEGHAVVEGERRAGLEPLRYLGEHEHRDLAGEAVCAGDAADHDGRLARVHVSPRYRRARARPRGSPRS